MKKLSTFGRRPWNQLILTIDSKSVLKFFDFCLITREQQYTDVCCGGKSVESMEEGWKRSQTLVTFFDTHKDVICNLQ
jgi:hypothetical protein